MPEVVFLDEAMKIERLIKQLMKSGSLRGRETTVIRGLEGRLGTIMFTSRLVILGENTCMLSLTMDITELRQMERQFRQAQ